MAQASINQQSLSPIFRLDSPETLDYQAIEATAAKPQRGAWRYLASIFDTASQRYCQQFSIEPDSTLWRLRYRSVDGFDEQIIDDPSVLIWALEALQIQLWGDEYHKIPNRQKRFTWAHKPFDQAVTLKVVQTVNGDALQFDLEPMRPMPPLLDEMNLTPSQLQELRARLKHNHGMVLITSPDPCMLDDVMLAINQELISPELKLLSVHERHRYSLPRTMQIDLPAQGDKAHHAVWQNALDIYHDALLIGAPVPEQFQEHIANNCDQGVLAIQTLRVNRAADSIDMLNANIIRRAPLHRSINSVLQHHPVRGICSHCAEQAILNVYEQAWLEQLRTPVTENVIGWLADGNTEQFMTSHGCDACANTGAAEPLAVFDLIYRDEKTNQFPNDGAKSAFSETIHPLQRQLMSLAKAGRTTLSEVIRVLENAA